MKNKKFFDWSNMRDAYLFLAFSATLGAVLGSFLAVITSFFDVPSWIPPNLFFLGVSLGLGVGFVVTLITLLKYNRLEAIKLYSEINNKSISPPPEEMLKDELASVDSPIIYEDELVFTPKNE